MSSIVQKHIDEIMPVHEIKKEIFRYLLFETFCKNCQHFHCQPFGCLLHTKSDYFIFTLNSTMYFSCLDDALLGRVQNLVCNDWADQQIWQDILHQCDAFKNSSFPFFHEPLTKQSFAIEIFPLLPSSFVMLCVEDNISNSSIEVARFEVSYVK